MAFHARLSLTLRRFAVTFPIAFVLMWAVAFISFDAAFVILVPLWIALVIAWPYLSRRMGFDFPKAPVPRTPESRGLASPDLGDCLAMTFAVKVAAR